ncbi:hypothetical protein BpHYR1_049315 [Brachionus plicatilis]|uniref:Uncharacterized protein n=1 Tax=Brachionus plicatilis TaxID=10195 RepID=A0A3M7SG41_BRAPC|nr:hypothetical protein BpHYR1_049315 [Brachionus plicatilis]
MGVETKTLVKFYSKEDWGVIVGVKNVATFFWRTNYVFVRVGSTLSLIGSFFERYIEVDVQYLKINCIHCKMSIENLNIELKPSRYFDKKFSVCIQLHPSKISYRLDTHTFFWPSTKFSEKEFCNENLRHTKKDKAPPTHSWSHSNIVHLLNCDCNHTFQSRKLLDSCSRRPDKSDLLNHCSLNH